MKKEKIHTHEPLQPTFPVMSLSCAKKNVLKAGKKRAVFESAGN
jgi:hypothetical protein